MIENEKQLSRELDYKHFLFNELEEAKLSLEDKFIEEELNKLENFRNPATKIESYS